MIKNLLEADKPDNEAAENRPAEVVSIFSEKPADEVDSSGGSTLETIRQSGLAYSAAIALAASVVFMLIIGWGADLLFDSSPWGIVTGIVIGAIIGFIQFFRINAQIFRK
jgi:F0F1-type ATP synthase assembly protein I